MIVGSLSTSFINYLYHLVMGRMLGPANYSVLAAVVSLLGLIGILPTSLGLVVTKFVSSYKSDQDTKSFINFFYKKVWITASVLTAIMVIISPLITSFLNIKGIYLLPISFLMFLFFIPSMFLRSVLQGLLRFKDFVLSFLGENGSKILVATALVMIGFSVGGALVSWVIGALVGLLVGTLALKSYLGTESQKLSGNLKPILFYSIPVLVQSLAVGSMYSSDLLLVKHFFSPLSAGLYASLSFLGRIIFFGVSPIAAAMFPMVSQKQAKGEGYRRLFLYSFLAALVLSSGVLMIYWLFPAIVIKLLYGSAYLGAASLLLQFGFFITIFTLSFLLINFFLAIGRVKIVIVPVVTSLLQVIGILLFHSSLGVVIEVSTICSLLLLISLITYYLAVER